MRRSVVYAVAGAALALAALLTLAGVADDPDALTNGQALVLGIVQGLTELLPISSSGHLILVPWAAEWTYLEENDRFNQTFDVALHLGTLVAVAAYFWGDLVRLVRAWLVTLRRRRIETPDERIAWFVVVATIPAGVAGLLGEDLIADNLGEPWQIAILLAAGALLLAWADRFPQERAMGDLGLGHAVAMGFAQALALAPGVSRSGITITAGRFMGLDRDGAARFSFLCCCRPCSARSCSREWGTCSSATSRTGGRGRSSSARSRRSGAGCSRSTGCSATCAGTRTACSSGTGSPLRRSSRSRSCPECVPRPSRR